MEEARRRIEEERAEVERGAEEERKRAERAAGADEEERKKAAETAKRIQELSISISRDTCSYQFQLEPPDFLDIDKNLLEKLVKLSHRFVPTEASWGDKFKEIGEMLAKCIFYDTPKGIEFFGRFQSLIDRENIKVRFNLDGDDLRQILVEALGVGKPWMLKTAIYRGLKSYGYAVRPPLFLDDATSKGPLNVLIIVAEVPRNAMVETYGHIKFPPLKNLEREASEIAALLSTLNCDVRIVGPADILNHGKRLVQDTLMKEGKWHIIHYVGHVHYDAQEHLGCVFFPYPYKTNQVEPVKIPELAYWLSLADTRFVFLSGSCTRAGKDFIYHLANEGVPAIMGFHWEVDDALARDYAMSFYRALLEHKSLEFACLTAEREMYIKHLDNPIWASPVLVVDVLP